MEELKTGREMRSCPRCGMRYTGRPAISRVDNLTSICPDCGTREALESIGVDTKEQEMMLEIIHRTMAQGGE